MAEKSTSRLERILPWSFLGVVLTLGLGIPALMEKKPAIVFEVQSESNVLDLHKPLPELQITFQGKDLRETGMNLRIIAITLRNEGATPILQDQYDHDRPWGFRIVNGSVINPPRILADNSEYLKESLNPKLTDDSTIELSKVIFEKGKYITLELLVLHGSSVEPTVVPFGKIAGIEAIQITRSTPALPTPTFINRLLDSPWWLHLLRFLLYVISVVLIVSTLVYVVSLMKKFLMTKEKLSKTEESLPKSDEQLQPLIDRFPKAEGQQLLTFYHVCGGNRNIIHEILSLVRNTELLQFIMQAEELERKIAQTDQSEYVMFHIVYPKVLFVRNGEGKIVPNFEIVRLFEALDQYLDTQPVLQPDRSHPFYRRFSEDDSPRAVTYELARLADEEYKTRRLANIQKRMSN